MLLNRLTLRISFVLLWLIFGNLWAATEQTPTHPIRVGGSIDSLHDSTVTDAEIAFRLIFNELLAEINESFTVKIYQDKETLHANLKDGSIQAIFTDSLHFMEFDKLIHPTGRFVVQFGPTLKQRYLILVRNSDKQLTLSDLHNRKICLSKGHPLGKLFLDVQLLQQGSPPSERFFGEVDFANANDAIVDLYFGNIDMALVPEFSYELARELNPQIGQAVMVLSASKPMINMVVGMRYDFPSHRLARIEPHILNRYPSKRFERLLASFHINGFYRASEDKLKEVRELNKIYQSLIHKAP